jgi:hypothetical protein
MLAISEYYREHQEERFLVWRAVAYLDRMAPVTPSPRSKADATRRAERVRVAPPLEHRADAPATLAGEGTRREHARMDLLVERARAARAS